LQDGLNVRFEKSKEQIEFYRQLRVLNPNNLPLMSSAPTDYSALRLDGCDEDFVQYLQCTKRDIDGPQELIE
jgi:hypothetical protein